MQNQKVENVLNLALDATDQEREKSEILAIGFEPEEQEWNLIIKYSGSLENVRRIASRTTELLNEYAVITIKESQIESLAGLPEVEYVEKPKRLYFQLANAKRVSCIDAVQDARFSLHGQKILIGIIDSGIDYMLEEFRKADGSTKIRYLWDQSIQTGTPPEGYQVGSEYTGESINEAIQAATEMQRRELLPSLDLSGHGTAVAGIAAGVAPESELIIVKLGNAMPEGFPRTIELMMGVDYVVRTAVRLGMPVAVNISFGYPSVAALTLWTGKYQKNPSNINLQFHHSIPLYL